MTPELQHWLSQQDADGGDTQEPAEHSSDGGNKSEEFEFEMQHWLGFSESAEDTQELAEESSDEDSFNGDSSDEDSFDGDSSEKDSQEPAEELRWWK